MLVGLSGFYKVGKSKIYVRSVEISYWLRASSASISFVYCLYTRDELFLLTQLLLTIAPLHVGVHE